MRIGIDFSKTGIRNSSPVMSVYLAMPLVQMHEWSNAGHLPDQAPFVLLLLVCCKCGLQHTTFVVSTVLVPLLCKTTAALLTWFCG